jgi:hypothetical protein
MPDNQHRVACRPLTYTGILSSLRTNKVTAIPVKNALFVPFMALIPSPSFSLICAYLRRPFPRFAIDQTR